MFPWMDGQNSPERVQSKYTRQQQEQVAAASSSPFARENLTSSYPIDGRANEIRQTAEQRYKAEYAAFYRNNVSELSKNRLSPDERKQKLQTPSESDAANGGGGGGGLLDRMAYSKRLLISSHNQKLQQQQQQQQQTLNPIDFSPQRFDRKSMQKSYQLPNSLPPTSQANNFQQMPSRFSQSKLQQQPTTFQQFSESATLIPPSTDQANPYDNAIGKRELPSSSASAALLKPMDTIQYRSSRPQAQQLIQFPQNSNNPSSNSNIGGVQGNTSNRLLKTVIEEGEYESVNPIGQMNRGGIVQSRGANANSAATKNSLAMKGEKNLLDEMYERDEREAELKRQRRAEYYRSIDTERTLAQRSSRSRNNPQQQFESNSSPSPPPQHASSLPYQPVAYGNQLSTAIGSDDRNNFNWKASDKSILQQIGDAYYKKQEKKVVDSVDFADQLQQQVLEKKREKQLEKERQEELERQSEAKVRQELEELKHKYELEMQGKQHEIKTLKKNVERKKADQIQKQADQLLSRTPPLLLEKQQQQQRREQSPEMTPRGMQSSQLPNDFKQSEWKVSKPNQEETVLALAPTTSTLEKQQSQTDYFSNAAPLQPNILANRSSVIPASASGVINAQQTQPINGNYHHTQATTTNHSTNNLRDFRRPKHLEEIDKLQFELTRRQQEMPHYQSQQFQQQQQRPFYGEAQQLRDRKLEEELIQLKSQLSLQTNLLQSGVQRIKLDERNALDLKSSALHDLESLKDSLYKQNQQESLKLRELQSSLGNLAYVQTDFLPQSSSTFSLGKQTTQKAMPGLLGLSNNYYPPGKSQNLNLHQPLYGSNASQGSSGSTSALNLQLEKRLNTVHLNKGEIQLLEVDNLLNNLRQGVY